LAEDVAVVAYASVVVARTENKQGGTQLAWVPPEATGRGPGFAFVPAQRPLDATEVVDLGLDLPAEETAIGGAICEQVDPTPISTTSDLDLLPDVPTEPAETTRDVAATPRVDEITLLAPTGKSERRPVERHAYAEQCQCG
jgi:hypothetical protein